MTVALYAAGLDPGIGMFHVDVEGRSSLSRPGDSRAARAASEASRLGIEIVSPPYSARPGQTVSSNFGISMNSNQSSATQVSVTIQLTLQDASRNQI